ncbi:hypothetical protein F5Y09DRAFT_351794 [Xylaria sp. FL1042]|nr:hypothetical protein F5Y09DRAFT_351794 [Xylaria sp. FL1042]
MVVPSDRISFASFEDDLFFRAYSSQPTSRHMSMSVVAPQRQGVEEEQLPENVNSGARPSEPLASVCQPLVEATLLDKGSPAVSSNVDKLPASPVPIITTRRSSSITGREQGLSTCHDQGRLPPVPRTESHGHVKTQGIDGILCNVRAFLAARRQCAGSGNPATTVTNENNTPLSSLQTAPYKPHLQIPAEPDDQYLITTDDIIGVIDIVIAGVRGIRDDETQLDCRSLLFPSGTHAKPTLCTQNIMPGVSAVADPATTICSPRPCFSLANDSEKFGHLSSTPKTTYNEMENNESVQRREMVADLYHDGVDAHTCIYNPLPILEEDPSSKLTPSPSAQFGDFQSDIHEYDNEWPSEACEGGYDLTKKPGRSIGVACHKRIRARSSLDQRQDITENLLDRLRRYSFVPLSEHLPEYIHSDRLAHPPWTERPQEDDIDLKPSGRELLQQILHRSNPPSIKDLSSNSGSRTPIIPGSQDSKLQGVLEGESCSSDAAPHICVNEQRTEESSL